MFSEWAHKRKARPRCEAVREPGFRAGSSDGATLIRSFLVLVRRMNITLTLAEAFVEPRTGAIGVIAVFGRKTMILTQVSYRKLGVAGRRKVEFFRSEFFHSKLQF